jgi:steroid delta-isomerase-like uncharacterized protein
MGDPAELARRWFKAIEDHDVEGAVEILDPDVDFSSPGGSFKGSGDARPFLQSYVDGFPDARFELSNVFSSGDRAMVEGTYSGTNTGAMQSPAGEMPATGKTVNLPFAAAMRVQGDRITQHHAYWDQMTFLGQLGLIPEGPAAS